MEAAVKAVALVALVGCSVPDLSLAWSTRFAQVEVLATLAVIFSQCMVRLAVDEYASDEEVERIIEEERLKKYG